MTATSFAGLDVTPDIITVHFPADKPLSQHSRSTPGHHDGSF
jgi:hypothetical protein